MEKQTFQNTTFFKLYIFFVLFVLCWRLSYSQNLIPAHVYSPARQQKQHLDSLDLNGVEPWLVFLEQPALIQPSDAKTAALKNILYHFNPGTNDVKKTPQKPKPSIGEVPKKSHVSLLPVSKVAER